MLVSLGLSDLIVATAHRTSTPWPETAAEYESLNFLAMDDYPSKEVVLSLEPDLIVGWGSLFADDALGATSDWNDRGINTYLMKNTVSGLGKRNFEFLIQDIENFGKIFDIEEKTDALVADIRSRLAAVEARTADIPEDERPTVLTVQMLKDNEWFARADTDLTANIIELAGGKCLDEEYGYASMEVLIDKNPDAILVIDRDQARRRHHSGPAGQSRPTGSHRHQEPEFLYHHPCLLLLRQHADYRGYRGSLRDAPQVTAAVV